MDDKSWLQNIRSEVSTPGIRKGVDYTAALTHRAIRAAFPGAEKESDIYGFAKEAIKMHCTQKSKLSLEGAAHQFRARVEQEQEDSRREGGGCYSSPVLEAYLEYLERHPEQSQATSQAR